MISPYPNFVAQFRRLVLVVAIASALVWLAIPRAHAEQRHVKPPLLAAASRFIGSGNFTHFRGPWCAAAVDKWLGIAGYRRLGSLRAVDYARYGRPSGAAPGAIAVMRHHIGIVVRSTARGVLVLSGNHRHRVGVGLYAPRKIIAFRSPV